MLQISDGLYFSITILSKFQEIPTCSCQISTRQQKNERYFCYQNFDQGKSNLSLAFKMITNIYFYSRQNVARYLDIDKSTFTSH